MERGTGGSSEQRRKEQTKERGAQRVGAKRRGAGRCSPAGGVVWSGPGLRPLAGHSVLGLACQSHARLWTNLCCDWSTKSQLVERDPSAVGRHDGGQQQGTCFLAAPGLAQRVAFDFFVPPAPG